MVKGDDGYYTLLNEEPSYYITENEQEANAYAAEVLAPFIVLFCCDVFETGNISELCDISVTSAEFRRVSLFSCDEQRRFRRDRTGADGATTICRIHRRDLDIVIIVVVRNCINQRDDEFNLLIRIAFLNHHTVSTAYKNLVFMRPVVLWDGGSFFCRYAQVGSQ